MKMRNLEEQECKDLLSKSYIGHLAYIYNDFPYMVPITYFFNAKDTILGYSAEGHKLEAMRLNPNVSLIISKIDGLDDWNSVLAHGIFEELSGSSAKVHLNEFTKGIKELYFQKEKKKVNFINEFSHRVSKDSDGVPVVFKIHVKGLTGRIRSDEKK